MNPDHRTSFPTSARSRFQLSLSPPTAYAPYVALDLGTLVYLRRLSDRRSPLEYIVGIGYVSCMGSVTGRCTLVDG